MKSEQISKIVREVNRINFEHRKNITLARSHSVEAVESFVDDSGLSREDLIDRLQSRLESNPEQMELLTIIEMLKQYE